MPQQPFTVKMMYKTELALAYGVSIKTVKAMLQTTAAHLKKEHKKDVFGPYDGKRLLTVKQITYLFEHNGAPE